MDIHEEILKWAKKYVPIFNDLSATYKTPYYTQSPIDDINEAIDILIIGINPKGNIGIGGKTLTAEQYIKGNPSWPDRFSQDGKIDKKWKFIHGARFFLGFDHFIHLDSIDNDQKTVWTNLSPFESNNGSNDLKKELMEIGLKSTLDLIKILQPKRIILLGIKAFSQIRKTIDRNDGIIEYSPVYKNIKSLVGRIYNIPTVCLPHPSGQWEVSNKFIPMFVHLHEMEEITNERDTVRPLKDVVEIMRTEMKAWQSGVII